MSTKPLILHAHASGPNPIKLAIAMEFLNLPYDIKMWDFGDDPKKGVKGASFTSINENGRVPALEDPNTGVVSWESGACLNYLRRVYDKQNILGPKIPKSSKKTSDTSKGAGVSGASDTLGAAGDSQVANAAEQATVDLEKWEYFLLTTLGPMTGQVNWYRHYNAQKNEDALQRYVEQTYRCYGVVEGQLGKSEGGFLLGELTAVDVHFEPWVHQYQYAGLSLDQYPKLKAWLEKMKGLKEVKEAYKKIEEAGKA